MRTERCDRASGSGGIAAVLAAIDMSEDNQNNWCNARTGQLCFQRIQYQLAREHSERMELPVKTTNFIAKASFWLAMVLASTASAAAAPFMIIRSFAYRDFPRGDLATDGDRLYGSTELGGEFGSGAVYAIGLDGSSFQTLHSFFEDGSPLSEGRSPNGGLLLDYDQLVGTTAIGTRQEGGGFFSISIYGDDFSSYNHFTLNSPETGWGPRGGLEFNPIGLLAGVNTYGGRNGNGVLLGFIDQTFGGISFSLPGGAGAVFSPLAGLATDGTTFYGTGLGGAQGQGAIFSINGNGTNYHIVHSFAGGLDGSAPMTKLTVADSKVFGTAGGALFSFNADGTGYHVLRNGVHDTGLTLVGDRLFGTNLNDVFSIKLDGTDYRVVYHVTEPYFDPTGGLTQVGDWLYGVSRGGGANDAGMLYAVAVPEPSSLILAAFALIGLVAWRWQKR
jgi:uncharacterized repeat protein (TIGR03803 family)